MDGPAPAAAGRMGDTSRVAALATSGFRVGQTAKRLPFSALAATDLSIGGAPSDLMSPLLRADIHLPSSRLLLKPLHLKPLQMALSAVNYESSRPHTPAPQTGRGPIHGYLGLPQPCRSVAQATLVMSVARQ